MLRLSKKILDTQGAINGNFTSSGFDFARLITAEFFSITLGK